jgi:hypothetical protein
MNFKGYKVDAVEIKNKPSGTPVFFNTLYSNVLACSKKHSGKSNLIYHILRNIVGKNTKLYFFSSTINKDPTWLQIQDEFGKTNEIETKDTLYERVKDGKRKVLVNHLENLVSRFMKEDGVDKKKKKKKDKKKEKQEGGSFYRLPIPYDNKLTWNDLEEDHLGHILFKTKSLLTKENKTEESFEDFSKKSKPKPVIKKGKLAYPEKIVVIDDLSQQLKEPIVAQLAKTNRHYKCVFIISTQFPNDLPPSCRSQFNQLFMWKGHSKAKCEVLRKVADLDLNEDEFYNLYRETTAEPYAFMYVDIDGGKAYKNFDEIVYE